MLRPSPAPRQRRRPTGALRRVASRLRRLPDASEILKLKAEGKPIDDVNQRILRQLAEGVLRTVAKDALDVAPPPVKIAERVVEFLLNDPLTADVIDKLRQEAVKVAGKVVGEDTADRIDRVNSLLIKFLRENKFADSPTADTKEVVRNIASDAVTDRDPLKLTASSQDKKKPKPTVIFRRHRLWSRSRAKAQTRSKPRPWTLTVMSDCALDGVLQFKRLSDRGKVQIYLPLRATGADIEVGLNPAGEDEILNISKFNQSEKSLVSRKERVVQVFRELSKAIDDKKLENITLLVPPGGLDPSVEDEAKKLSAKVSERTDIRFDIGLVGTATIPPLLRDLSHLTTGSVLTITDIDEVGAVAQRLAYEQTQGNWVIIPEQGRIDIPASKEYAAVAKATHDKKAFDKALEEAKKKGDAGAIKDAQAKVDHAGDLLKKAKKDYEEAYDQAGDLLKKAKKDYEEAYDQAAKPIDQDEDMPRKPAQTLYERLEGTRVRHVPLRFTDRYRRLLALKPIYVDGKSQYDLILGLSQALRNIDLGDTSLENLRALPRLGFKIGAFANEQGRRDIEAYQGQLLEALEEDLYLETGLSTDSILVYRLPALVNRGLAEGWYTPVLKLSDAHLADKSKGDTEEAFTFHDFHDNFIHYTFSVGTLSPDNQVLASLIQDAPQGKEATSYRGTLNGDADFAVVQAAVCAGLPIKGVDVTGYVQRLEEGSTSPIRTTPVAFLDDGVKPDLKAGDGIYTATIGLARDPKRGGEYRVFVVAKAVSDPRFVDTGESIQMLDEEEESVNPDQSQNLRAPRFERATSVQFRVMPKVN